MDDINSVPPFMLFAVWHPESPSGEILGNTLLDHFGSHRYRHVSGGNSVRVIFRNAVTSGTGEPLPVDWEDSQTVAVVVFLDNALVRDDIWINYVRNLESQAEELGFRARLIPVVMEAGIVDNGFAGQALLWHDWDESQAIRELRLVRELKYTFSRMLRHRLAELRHPGEDRDSLGDYLEKVQVFLSHSKHDDYGEAVARQIRRWLIDNAALATFMDIFDIPPGVSFESVINHEAGGSVMVAIYTDSYSSREWCRKEVVRAKRQSVPMLVMDCLQEGDERSFPYMGNVPWVRMNPETMDRLEYFTGYLLGEGFKDFLWQCRVEALRSDNPETVFLSSAPELFFLASLPQVSHGPYPDIVYPGPPLGVEELELIANVAPDIRLFSLIEWIARREL